MNIFDIFRKPRTSGPGPQASAPATRALMHPHCHDAILRLRQLAVSRRRVRILADGSVVIRKRPRHQGLPICLPRDVRGVAGKAVPACR